ncbi:hypothetical protein H5410_057521 [Solanum commersonii]|uniref:Ubiquitin-like protease family profile domain-containing protein n=1 Tax=Solanum commersonii TaxID=4109 RepID=A0A9J5WN48_SOLCO|nr:hypothetical protein H5410_057521 [Solanum commersonii]
MDPYRYTTVNCLFKSYVNIVYNRYYCSPADDTLSTKDHIFHVVIVSVYERSIKDIINRFSIPAALPWHLVNEVYILVYCDGDFHWLLVVVVFKKSGFFDKTERTDWAALDAYKDKEIGELIGPQHSFEVEFAQDIMQQQSDSLLKYGIDKIKVGYVTDNDDPTRPKNDYTSPAKDGLINVE